MNVKNIKKRIFAVGFASFVICTVPIPNSAFTTVAKASQHTTTPEKDSCNAKLNVKKKLIVTNSSYTLKVYNLEDNQTVTFKSDDTEIATVDKEGVITTNDKNGTCIITATVKEKSKTVKSLECEITVGPPAASIVLVKSELSLVVGKRYPFLENLLIIKPNTTVEVPKFSSSNEDVAVISSTGKISTKEAGSCVIKASLENGSSVSCLLTVIEDSDK
ncbi:Ig-like domain-containing protein [Anaerosporobacter faecicola]|uniref:Ig-like domain-containing protein n=1 Tax=Anaerosporobacter faecicola TaxID=2718714 RepID=UPI001439488B|nr:Ig-like domain-containing protein [Anaerosporobacter faecicola]